MKDLSLCCLIVAVLCVAGTAAAAGPNIAPNPTFDTSAAGWTDGTECTWAETEGAPPGSLRVGASIFEFYCKTGCFDATSIAGLTDVGFGGVFKAAAGTPSDCDVEFRVYSSADCSSGETFLGSSAPIDPDTTSFQLSTIDPPVSVPSSTLGATLTARCYPDPAGADEVLVDNVFLGSSLVPVELVSFSAD